MRRSRWGVGSCDCGCWLLVCAAPYFESHGPPLVPLSRFPGSSPLQPHLYYRPRSRSCSRPHPFSRAHSRTCLRSRSRPRSCSCHRFLFSVPGALFSSRYHIVRQVPGLAPKAVGYLQGPPSVYRDDGECGRLVSSILLRLFSPPPLLSFNFRSLSRLRYCSRFHPAAVPFTVSATALVYIPLPFPFPSCVCSLVSAPNPDITSGQLHTKLDLSLSPFAL